MAPREELIASAVSIHCKNIVWRILTDVLGILYDQSMVSRDGDFAN